MYHHKEAKPIKTISKIRTILSDLSLLPTEKWHVYINGLYSLRLTLPGIATHIGVNGKGVSKELAMASAYGELMERLQNQLLYPLFMYYDFDKELKKYHNFEIDPNEKKFTTQQIMNNLPKEILKHITDNENTFIKSFRSDTDDVSVCLPYFHYNSGSTIYFPKDSFFYYYGSNGMASGNTLEEAVVQGLSEIFERHVMRLALYNKETFPAVSSTILQSGFPDELEIIREIERSTNFRIKVLDCTMDCRFPVIGIIVANNKTHKHFVRFGAHPDLHIALERCLTELLQGRDIQDLNNMIDFKFSYEHDDGKESINFHNIFRDGWGYYPNSFFFDNSKYTIDAGFIGKRYKSNKECLDALLGMVKSEKLHLLIRNVGFLGFPAVSVLIPGMSEVSKIDEENIYSLNNARKTAISLRNIEKLDQKEKEKILKMAEYHGVMQIKPDLIKLVNLPINRSHPYSKINTSLISAIIFRSMNDYEKSIQYIDEYMENMVNELSDAAKSYFKCARNYLILLKDHETSIDIRDILCYFFEPETVDKVIKEFSVPDYLIKDLGKMNCPDCKSCSLRSSCSYETIRNMHKDLKHKMKENPIDQNDVAEIFI